MFLWKIEDLAEYFIYSNDDFFAVGPLQPQHFFNFEEGRVKNSLSNGFKNKPSMTMYQHHCLNGYSLVSGKEEDKVPLCFHLMRPYIKSNMIEAFESNKEELLNRISRFREITNINVYYFDYYLVKSGLQEPRREIVNRVVDSKMFYRDVYAIITTIGLNMLAIQDTSSILDIYKSSTITNWFSNRFNFKSKYEI